MILAAAHFDYCSDPKRAQGFKMHGSDGLKTTRIACCVAVVDAEGSVLITKRS